MSAASIGFSTLVQEFFQRRLLTERGASAHTIASYRDTFALLLAYAETRTGRTPSALSLADLDAPLVLDFLDHLEADRGNTPRTRNLRLTAIRSFMRYASLRAPDQMAVTERVLAISPKRFDRPVLDYLTREEVQALLAAPDRTSWSGRRDAILLSVLYNSGARVSELAGLRVADLLLDRGAALRLHGKGRKERVVPLWKSTATQLRRWLTQIDQGPTAPVFPSRAGAPLTRSGIAQRLAVTLTRAQARCPSLAGRCISPHTLRHTTAMHLLQAGVDITVIALWLGHEDTATTQIYLHADLQTKEAALRRLDDPRGRPVRYTVPDRLLGFLEAL